MKFAFRGEIPSYLTAKDLILAVIGEIGVDGATYRSMYFAGDGIGSLTLEDRMTLTNMAIEAGGKNGVCDVDEKTLAYVRKSATAPTSPPGKSSPTTPAQTTSSKRNGTWRLWSPWSPSPTPPITRTRLTTADPSSSTRPTSAPAPAEKSPT
jgi:homoaconitase/3-isopropylmalate dehydratase large subunit